ncbi:MAG TPA: Fe-S cluster assembly protein SufD, partial [Acidimicrobiia bacterium]|nr:Fe-S cluster assembly protein SufD [Acidimicrobiia bacterium]
RYVEVETDLDRLGLAEPGSPLPPDSMIDALGDLAGGATVVDGVTTEAGSDGPARVVSAAEAYGDPAFQRILTGGVPADLDRFAAAAQAFSSDGVFIHVPRGTHAPGPYVVDVQATAADAVSFPRIALVVEDGGETEVVVRLRSADGVAATIVPVIDVVGGANARARLTILQTFGDSTRSVTLQRMVAGRDGTMMLAEAGLGGRNARMHLTVDLAGRGADAQILGVYFGDHDRTLDYRYFMNHRAPNTTSEMALKGAVGDTAKSVFTGLIRIEPEGQKTNAHQTNRNLVLSEGAEAHSVPNLEILANDVRCGHGSAVGPLDEEQRYYLMSRGLDPVAADRLQVIGFFEDVLGRFPQQEFDPALRSIVTETYAGIIDRQSR